jgi:hypothetical protein
VTNKFLGSVVLLVLASSTSLATSYPSYSAIPIEQCRVGGFGIGTDYTDVINSLGPADEEKAFRDSASGAEKPGKALIYKDLHIAFSRDRLVMLNDTGVGLALPNGISVGSSEVEVIAAFGVQPVAMDDRHASLAFVCVRPDEKFSGILLELRMIGGSVDYIVLHKIN